jgi:hypothetical protein
MASNDGQNSAPETAVRGQAPATTRHATGGIFVPHGPVLLHGVAHELGDKLSVAATGQAELFGLRDRADVVLKVYFAGRNPKARATKEMLERYQAIRSPHLMRLLDFGFGADGLDGQHDWELLERLEEMVAPAVDETRLGWIAATVVPAVRASIDALLSQHLVHCDVKRGNLMRRGSSGDLVLVDIGSLKEIDPVNRTSVTTVLSTTTVYAAPELLRHHVNDTTDAFALGMLLLDLVNPALIAPPADKEVVARITENKPVVDVIPTAPRLTDLINGLTRNAVSARWGVGELAIWCSGGTVSKADSARTLPPMRVQGRQITAVDELLSFMQDEGAFWGVCEDEGDLPFTLRQWVNQLHDDEVGAALSRLVKRCLTEGKQEVGLVAVRRVLVPRAPLSVRGRQLAPTEDALSDFIARTGEVTVDMEIALRVWSHRADAGRAARVLELVAPNSGDSDDPVGTAKRKRFDLYSGIGTISKDWAGAKIRCSLLRGSDGRLPAAELDAAAESVLAAVPVGSSDGSWTGDLLPVAVLFPHASSTPSRWAAVAAAIQHHQAVLLGDSYRTTFALRLEANGVSTAPPALLRHISGWPPGAAWLRMYLGSTSSSDDGESTAEQVLCVTQRPWLLAGERVLEAPEALRVGNAMDDLMRWFGGDVNRGGRIASWFQRHAASELKTAATANPVSRAHTLLWSAGLRDAWLGTELFTADRVVASLDKITLNRLASAQNPLALHWLKRVVGEVEWDSPDTINAIVSPRAYAVELCRVARLACVAEKTIFVEDGVNGAFQIRVVSWNEISSISFRLLVAAFEQGSRTPHCKCGYPRQRCECFLEAACSAERELAKKVVEDITIATADRLGGPSASVMSNSRPISTAMQFSQTEPRMLEDAIRSVSKDGWPQGEVVSRELVTVRSVPIGFVPPGSGTSSIRKRWVLALLVLLAVPILIAAWPLRARQNFNFNGVYFDLVVFIASLGLGAWLIDFSVFRNNLKNRKAENSDLGCLFITVFVPLVLMSFYPFGMSVLVSIGASVMSIFMVSAFLSGRSIGISRHRRLLAYVVVSVVMIGVYQSTRPELELGSWSSDPALRSSWTLTSLASSRWTPAILGMGYLAAAVVAIRAVRHRSEFADARVRGVEQVNSLLSEFNTMILSRMTDEKFAHPADSNVAQYVMGGASADPPIGSLTGRYQGQSETNFWLAHIMIRSNRMAIRFVTLSWSETTQIRHFGPRFTGTPDIVMRIDESDWNRVLTGADSPRALQADGRLELSGDTVVVDIFVQKLAQFRETPR